MRKADLEKLVPGDIIRTNGYTPRGSDPDLCPFALHEVVSITSGRAGQLVITATRVKGLSSGSRMNWQDRNVGHTRTYGPREVVEVWTPDVEARVTAARAAKKNVDDQLAAASKAQSERRAKAHAELVGLVGQQWLDQQRLGLPNSVARLDAEQLLDFAHRILEHQDQTTCTGPAQVGSPVPDGAQG